MKACYDADYPRVMVALREPFNWMSGPGITISNLFMGWPKDKLSSVCWSSIAADNILCDRVLRLGKSELDWMVPLKWLRNVDVNGISVEPPSDRKGQLSSTAFCAARSAWRCLLRHTGRGELLKRFRPSDQLKDFVTQFRPDLIYCQPTDSVILQLVDHIANVSGAGVVLHVYDDWLARLRTTGVLNRVYEHSVQRRFKALVRKAVLRLAIGEMMAEEFRLRYHQPFFPFQNCPEPELWIENGKKAAPRIRPFTFRFLGTMYFDGNTRALKIFAGAVERLRDLLPEPPIFEIWTTQRSIDLYADEYAVFSRTRFAVVCGDNEAVARLYGTADALVIAYDKLDSESAWLRYSMPTKLPAYMLSGTPVVVLAPSDYAVTQFLLRRECALVNTAEPSVESVAQWLAQLYRNQVGQREMALRAREVALKELVASVVRPAFHKLLREAATQNKN
jgi:glycosyltransferase involved in cell wall biosynthesis